MFAHDKQVPLFVLGGGSNVLVGDSGFPGLVLKMELRGLSFEAIGGDAYHTTVSAGESWDGFVDATVGRSLSGLENLSGIPGTVGGAVVGNIGAYGREVKDSLISVTVFDTQDLSIRVLKRDECQFDYRQSIFKKPPGRPLIVLSAVFALRSHGVPDVSYKELAQLFPSTVVCTAPDVRRAVLSIRARKLPDWKSYPTAGSYFKNPVVSTERFVQLQKKYPDIVGYPAKEGMKVSAGYLIDHVAHLRGFREGDVGTFEKQALVIVNYGGASARDIKKCAQRISRAVFEQTSILLEEEVESIGDF
jgi:UDP-N-acetylmuramate dehydrogenase